MKDGIWQQLRAQEKRQDRLEQAILEQAAALREVRASIEELGLSPFASTARASQSADADRRVSL